MILEYTFRNQWLRQIIFIIEPWAEEVVVPPGCTLSLTISHTKPGLIETSLTPDYFTIWLWGGCTLTAYLDKKELPMPALSIPVPL
jgi:hypothetical protein